MTMPQQTSTDHSAYLILLSIFGFVAAMIIGLSIDPAADLRKTVLTAQLDHVQKNIDLMVEMYEEMIHSKPYVPDFSYMGCFREAMRSEIQDDKQLQRCFELMRKYILS